MYRHLRFVLIVLLCVGCLEPYAPPISAGSDNSLVVDGHLDSNGSATVKLTRAIPLSSFAVPPLEEEAIVTITSSSGEIFNLVETQPGNYSVDKLTVNKQATYSLHIRTSDGNEYVSDEVQIHPTPSIDKVYYSVSATGDGLEIKADSRDTNPNTTGYYLWESIETYQYHSTYFSRYKRVDGQPILRRPFEYVDTCWREERVPIITTSTNKLSENFISGKVLTTINLQSPKISMRYSMLVRQRAISGQEYTYRTQLAKTEKQGTLFAEIPGSVVSNLHSTTNANEFVLGYFRGQEIKEKRIFIDRLELPLELQVTAPDEICDLEGTCPTRVPSTGPNQCIDVELLSENKIIISSYEVQNAIVYLFTPIECGDCRQRGGVTRKPDFW